jgi:hypothetical protein
MEKTNKILLNKTKSYNSINVNSQIQFGIDSTNKPIPLNDISTNINQFDQFEKERKESSIYRFYGNVIPIISNPLYNDNIKITGSTASFGSIKIFTNDIFEKNGWIGYYNDELDETALQFNDNKSALCEFIPFDPGFNRLKMLDSDGIPNYLFKVTYPFRNKDITLVKNGSGVSLKDGIPIIEKFEVEINGRLYVGFKTAINHGLSDKDVISLFNFTDNTTNQSLTLTAKTYRVFKLGNQTNDLKFRTFVIDLDPSDIDFTIGVSTVKRVVQNKLSQYYVREFKSLSSSDYKDYDIYPASFGVSYYDDKISSFNFKKDIDVKDQYGNELVDNLGRPLSELYFTTIKNDEDAALESANSQYWLDKQSGLASNLKDRFWTRIVAGYDIENNENVNYNIRAFGDPVYSNNEWYSDIDETDEIFDGDIVEYNGNELLERRLELTYHRINTIYREYLNTIDSSQEDKKEGYIYKPFNKIQIREFSNYINPVVDLQYVIDKYNITDTLELNNLRNSYRIPSYATEISPNVFKWRDLLEIGEVDNSGAGVDYPFESGAHYINLDKRFYLQRQDPPCEFVIITEDIELGAGAPANEEQRFIKYLTDPTFLNYSFVDTEEAITAGVTGDDENLYNYNGTPTLNIDVNLADFIGEYELGKRDVAGGCVDLSLLKQKDVDDVC